MICPECDTVIRDCECALLSGDCFEVNGSGNDVALSVVATLDPDTDNLLTCSGAGLLAQLPAVLLTPPAAQAYASGNLSIANETGTVVALDSERYDNASMHSTVTNNSRLTFTVAGVYIVTFDCSWAGNVTGDRSCWIRKNGAEFLAASQKHALSSASFEMGMSATVQEAFIVGDYVEAVVKQDSGGALNLLATRYSPILSARFRRLPPT